MDTSPSGSRIIEFFRTERKRLVALVRRWINDTADRDGEDVVQDVMLSLLSRPNFDEPIEDISRYVVRMIRNKAIDLYRRRKPQTVSLDATVNPEINQSLVDYLEDKRSDVAIQLDRKEATTALYRVIDTLPAEQRAVLIATELEGRAFDALSKEWGIPIGTLLARKHRAMKSIRAELNLAFTN